MSEMTGSRSSGDMGENTAGGTGMEPTDTYSSSEMEGEEAGRKGGELPGSGKPGGADTEEKYIKPEKEEGPSLGEWTSSGSCGD